MSATLYKLPIKARRDLDVIDTPFQLELQQVAIHLSDATTHLMDLVGMRPQIVKPSLDKGIEAIEAVLFHALSMRGCSNADLVLFRELARRNNERG